MSDTRRRTPHPPSPSRLGEATDAAAIEAAIPPGFPVPDGLTAGRERMERLAREEAERVAREQARLAALDADPDGAGAETPRQVTRATRKPFGSQNQKLFLPPRAGFHRHWFNEHPGRIEEALAAGYAHVMDARGQPISRIVGRNDRGDGLRAYAMEIPQEWFDEDMRRGQELVDSRAAGIKRGDLYPVDHGYLSARTKVSDNSR